jgi:hypothetical protein
MITVSAILTFDVCLLMLTQIDNLEQVREKWNAIVGRLDKNVPIIEPAAAYGQAGEAGPSSGGEPTVADAVQRHAAGVFTPEAARKYVARLCEARIKLPAMLQEEADFWADKGASTSAPFAAGHDHGGFLIHPEKRQCEPLTPEAQWALSALDAPGLDVPEGVTINTRIK